MDPQPGLEQPRPLRRARSVAVRFLCALVGVLLLVALLSVAIHRGPEPKIAWLTPAEWAQAEHASPLAGLRDRVMNLTAPFLRWYWNNKPRITVDSKYFTLTAQAAAEAGLGLPIATNTGGMRAWIVSSGESTLLQQRFKALPGVSLLSNARVQTFDGNRAQISFIDPARASAGLTTTVLPRTASGSVKLLFRVASTEPVTPSPGNPAAVRTNFATACRALIPNTGSLVIDGGEASGSGGKSCWLVLSPTVTDLHGNLIQR